VSCRKLEDQIAVNQRQRARRRDETAVWGARECRDGTLDLRRVAHVDRDDLHPERRRHGLDNCELTNPGGDGGIPKDRYTRHVWRGLLEQFKPFPGQIVFEEDETGDIAARARQAINEAGSDRVGDIHEHNRHCARRL
jgi:hypothetical protein